MVGREKLLVMIGALLSCICIYLMFQASTVGLVIFYQCLSTIGSVLVVTPALTLPLKYISKDTVGSATGCIYFGGQTAGIIAPSLMGFMIHRFNGSYQAAFWVMIVGMFIPFLVSLALRTKGKSAEAEPGSMSDAEVAL
ncbi:MFS transporter [Paenibacillus filicis]|uniref:MFS transporter n=1 Tax=Paenibacillus gyeongsangnamensis TaxID=3388067 RepID=A0ABT4Q6M1_9BACL|nr:MFS transporter [Paenibacillus filicis]MCZ8512520.1 MFS transporter [Paenibacillus filicis]